MEILNVLEVAGSMAAVAAIGGFGLLSFGAVCVGIVKESLSKKTTRMHNAAHAH